MSLTHEYILAGLARREQRRLEQIDLMSPSLLAGDMGSLVFLYEYSRVCPAYRPIADDLLDKMLHSLHCGPLQSSYCNGLTGFAIALNALVAGGFVEDFSASLSSFDAFIASGQAKHLKHNHHDFLHGFVGLGFYWLMRYASRPDYSTTQMRLLVKHLLNSCEKLGETIRWPLKESLLVKRYNISLSHGCSATLILLCRMLLNPLLAEICGDEIRHLARGTVAYILNNQIDPAVYGSWFPTMSLDCAPASSSRLAWCYGDLGVSLALREAAKTLGDSQLLSLSLRVLEYAATRRRSLHQNIVSDACVCHGAAGIGLIFREMARAERSEALRLAADYWHDIVLRLAIECPDDVCYHFYHTSSKQHREGIGILEGNAGIGLYLLNERTQSPIGSFLLIKQN